MRKATGPSTWMVKKNRDAKEAPKKKASNEIEKTAAPERRRSFTEEDLQILSSEKNKQKKKEEAPIITSISIKEKEPDTPAK